MNQVRHFYDITPLFRQMKSSNSFSMNLFKKGFKKMFFGRGGIVTKRSQELKNYYKSLDSELDLNSKIYAGSLDYYDYLSHHDSYFERLKESRKKILKISGNFAIANNSSDKLRAAYLEYEKKRRKSILLKKNKKNLTEGNKYNISNYNNDFKSKTIIDNKIKTKMDFYSKNRKKNIKKILLLNKPNIPNEMLKTQSTFFNYKKNIENIKKNEPYFMNYTSYKFNNKFIKNNESSIKNDDNNINNISQMEKNDFIPIKRDNKKSLSNITTINNENQEGRLIHISKSFFNPFNIHKNGIKRKNTFILHMPIKIDDKNDKLKNNLNHSNSNNLSKYKINTKLIKNKIQVENHNFNKSFKSSKFSDESLNNKNNNNIITNNIKENSDINNINNKVNKQSQSIKELKKSLKQKIDLSEPSNIKVENSLNNFIINTTKAYELKKKNLLKQEMKEELVDMKDNIKSIDEYYEMAKHVDFSDFKSFSPEDNHIIKTRVKPSSYNLAFSYKTRFQKNVPVKDFIKSLEKIKEKEREKKYIKNTRSIVKKNFRVIHNLTINLDYIKKKYNYE